MPPGPRIVLDANILIRAVLGARVKKIITDHAEHTEFFAPEVAYGEAQRHLPEILAKHDRASQIDEALAYRGNCGRSCCRCRRRSTNP